MKTILILLLMAAPATAAWDLNNLTPRQRASLITTRNRWNNGYHGRPRQTGCPGIRHSYWVHPNVSTGRRATIPTPVPLTIINPYVEKTHDQPIRWPSCWSKEIQ